MNTAVYIEHSGFLLELDDIALLFDYYRGDIPKTDNPLYIFSSHRHHDHFNKKIMDIPCKKLILSSDIRVVPNERTLKTGANKSFDIDGMEIKTLRSTDAGVAFIVKYKNVLIYHAGDLNDWHWKGEPDDWNSKMTAKYRRIITEGFKDIPSVDIAFIPVDGRLEDHAFDGADFFMKNVDAKNIFPMHFWKDYELVRRFCEKYPDKNILKIGNRDQRFEIK